MPIVGGKIRMLDEEPAADNDEYGDYGELDEDNHAVELGRFLDANHQDRSDDDDGKEGHQVERAGCVREQRAVNSRRKRSQRHPFVFEEDEFCSGRRCELWCDIDMKLRQQSREVS